MLQGRTDFTNYPLFLYGSTNARDNETILQDAGRVTVLKSQTLMARICVAAAAAGVADAGNAANTGTVTGVALIAGTLPKVGAWVLACTVAAANGGTFKLTDPDGNIVRNDLVMAAGAGLATTFYVPEVGLKFVITDGAVDFLVGEKFTVAITAVNKWAPFNPAAVNGAQIPRGIFIGDDIAAATLAAGDVVGQPILVYGHEAIFDDSQLTIENAATLATVLPGGDTVREALYKLGFFAKGATDVDYLENT